MWRDLTKIAKTVSARFQGDAMDELIERFVDAPNEPTPQSGEVTLFARRKPAESELGTFADADALYDFIRMLDAEDYPRAFVRRGQLRLEFSNASLDGNGMLNANVHVIYESQP